LPRGNTCEFDYFGGGKLMARRFRYTLLIVAAAVLCPGSHCIRSNISHLKCFKQNTPWMFHVK